MNNLVDDRQWYVDRKAALTLRLGKTRTMKAFEQVLKQINYYNQEIRKLNQVIRDHKTWL